MTIRAIAIIGIGAVASGIFLSLSTPPAWSQSPNGRARCLSIADVDQRVECLENAGASAQPASSAMRPVQRQDDRELDCRNPQDAALCRQLESQQGFRGGAPQPPMGAYQPPAAQAPAQYGAPQPSFNCARAATVIEQAICSDATLAQWDARMGQLYRQALAIQNNSPTLIGDQNRWRAQRNSSCSGTNFNETKSCALEMTKARVGGLAAVVAASGENPNSSPPSAAPVPYSSSSQNPPTSPAVSVEQRVRNREDAPDSITVGMSFTATSTNPPMIKGTTNLPDGTTLFGILHGIPIEGGLPACSPSCYFEFKDMTVENGRFASELKGATKLISDSYIIDVTTNTASFQPQNVQSVIGKSGEHLRGPYVFTMADGGKYVAAQFPRMPVPSDSEKFPGFMIHYSLKISVVGNVSSADAQSDLKNAKQKLGDALKDHAVRQPQTPREQTAGQVRFIAPWWNGAGVRELYSESDSKERMAQYQQKRTEYVGEVVTMFFAVGCKVVAGEGNISPLRINEAMALLAASNVLLDLDLDDMQRKAARDGLFKATQPGECDYWRQHPEAVYAFRRAVEAAWPGPR